MDNPDLGQQIARLLQLLRGGGETNPTPLERRYGEVKLREAMGGEPAFFGPINRGLYGVPLRPDMTPEQVQELMHQQMGKAQAISNAVPRGWTPLSDLGM